MGKQKCTSCRVPGRADKSKQAIDPGELIYTDIEGGGKMAQTRQVWIYTLIALDEATENLTVKLLKEKSEAAGHISHEFIRVNNRGTPMRPFRGDNAGKNASKEMLTLYDEFKVQWEPTAPYKSNQNTLSFRLPPSIS